MKKVWRLHFLYLCHPGGTINMNMVLPYDKLEKLVEEYEMKFIKKITFNNLEKYGDGEIYPTGTIYYVK